MKIKRSSIFASATMLAFAMSEGRELSGAGAGRGGRTGVRRPARFSGTRALRRPDLRAGHVAPGWRVSGGNFVPPPPISLEDRVDFSGSAQTAMVSGNVGHSTRQNALAPAVARHQQVDDRATVASTPAPPELPAPALSPAGASSAAVAEGGPRLDRRSRR